MTKEEDLLKRYAIGERDFRGIDLRGADFRGEDLSDANFFGANFCDAGLCGVNLQGSIFRGAKFRHTDLSDANFFGADLRESNITSTYLWGANLKGAHMPEDTGTSEVAKAYRDKSWLLFPYGDTRTTGLTKAICRYLEDYWWIGKNDIVEDYTREETLRLATAKDIMELSE